MATSKKSPKKPIDQPGIPAIDSVDFDGEIKDALKEAKKRRGKVNIIVAGQTGVGKSTLINAVFGAEVAKTGMGKPVTKNTDLYTVDSSPLAIWDTRGLEVDKFEETMRELESLVIGQKKSKDPNDHIHIAWICINEGSRRVQPAEEKLHEMLAKHMPVVAVVTQARDENGMTKIVKKHLPKARKVLPVIAKPFGPKRTTSSEGAMGLSELVIATDKLVPEAQRIAFRAAQKVDVELKKAEAQKVVHWAAAAAATVAATPIPFSDAVLIMPIQLKMMACINAAYGIELDKRDIRQLLVQSMGPLLATVIGKSIVNTLLKFIPILGSVISAATAAGLTEAMGHAYISTIISLTNDRNIDDITAKSLGDAFAAVVATKTRSAAGTQLEMVR